MRATKLRGAPELANQVDDLLGGGAGSEGLVAAAEGRRDRRSRAPVGPRNVWDSPLLLIGGGSLIGLILLGAVLLFVMRRQTGDQAFDIGEQAYKAGSFGPAIAAFDQIGKIPEARIGKHRRVHRGLAEMRAAAESTRDWTKVLATTKTGLDQISPEVEFPTAQADLASILPAIAQGLANQAHQKPAAELVGQAKEAVALVDKYVPVTLQPTEQLREVSALFGPDRAAA